MLLKESSVWMSTTFRWYKGPAKGTLASCLLDHQEKIVLETYMHWISSDDQNALDAGKHLGLCLSTFTPDNLHNPPITTD